MIKVRILFPDTMPLYIAVIGHDTQTFPHEHGLRGWLLCRSECEYVGRQRRRSGWKMYKRKFILLV
jgi:hypothetical protein